MKVGISAGLPRKNRGSKIGRESRSKHAISLEQVRAIADRVYLMMLRDLKYEWERERFTSYKSGPYKGGW